ncbi:MAG: ComF family protein [Armatimonadota bacterium]
MLKHILNFIFPPRCLICRSFSSDIFCKECLKDINFLDNIRYFKRSVNTVSYSSAVYSGSIKKALGLFKFKKKVKIAPFLSSLMNKTVEKNDIIKKHGINVIVPVPMHKNMLRRRGFNQSRTLAEHISSCFNIPLNTKILIKNKDTVEQNKLSKKERLVNLKDSFKVNKNEINKDLRILLIDDVYTTGTTIKECVKALKRNKQVKEVVVLTLARTV